MAKSVKKVAKKVAKKTNGNGKQEATREAVIRLLLRKTGATLTDIKEAGLNQAAAAALRMAETRGYKTKSSKEEGELTRYFAFGTPSATGAKKQPAKKAAKKAKKAAKRKPAAAAEVSASA